MLEYCYVESFCGSLLTDVPESAFSPVENRRQPRRKIIGPSRAPLHQHISSMVTPNLRLHFREQHE